MKHACATSAGCARRWAGCADARAALAGPPPARARPAGYPSPPDWVNLMLLPVAWTTTPWLVTFTLWMVRCIGRVGMWMVKSFGMGSCAGIPLGGFRCTLRVFGPVCSMVPVNDTSRPSTFRPTFMVLPPADEIVRPDPPPPSAELTLEKGITPVPVTWLIVPLW